MSNPKPWISESYNDNLVSVVIPTFNRKEYISESILSVYNQTYRPIECILVDDGSTDGTEQVVIELIQRLNSTEFALRYLKQDNQGAQAARNYGTKVSVGEYIQYLDSDDLLNGHKILEQVSFLKNNKIYDGVYGDWNKGTPSNYEQVMGKEARDLIGQFIGERCIPTFSFLLKRSAIIKTGPWDERIKRNQEIEFHIRGILNGCRFKYIPCETGLWRIHNSERIANKTGLKQILFFYRIIIDLLKSNNQLSSNRSNIIGQNIFWNSISNINERTSTVIEGLLMADQLNQNIPNLNTRKMKVLKKFFGHKLALKLWYKRMIL